mgnify:CR=1 FL=1
MTIQRHRGESITPDLAYKGSRWESMRHKAFTAKGPHHSDQVAEALLWAALCESQLFELTGEGID